MEKKEKVLIGSDHAGFDLKEHLKGFLSRKGIPTQDMGNTIMDPMDDYPPFAYAVAKKVADTNGRGILICGSGVGVCISANKVKGIRAVNTTSEEMAVQSRLHNDANILCLGQNFVSKKEAEKIVEKWLTTPFSHEERHQRRVDKIQDIEK